MWKKSKNRHSPIKSHILSTNAMSSGRHQLTATTPPVHAPAGNRALDVPGSEVPVAINAEREVDRSADAETTDGTAILDQPNAVEVDLPGQVTGASTDASTDNDGASHEATLVPMALGESGLKDESVKAVEAEAMPSTAVAILPEGDPIERRLSEIRKVLDDHAATTALVHAELIAEWVALTDHKESISGQTVQKSRRGRPQGGIAKAARELPVPGDTEDARRKVIERALKIAKIEPEAKLAAQAAGLDRKPTALLDVARERTVEAQLDKVHVLAERKRAPRRKRHSEQATADQIGASEGDQADARLAEATESHAPALTDPPPELPRGVAPDEALAALTDFARFVIERIGRRGKNIVVTVTEGDVHEFAILRRMAERAITGNDGRATPH
jgi:hypothetical protein